MDILAALEILRTAPDSLLLSHSVQTISTLRNVGARLKTDLLTSSASIEEPLGQTLRHPGRKRKQRRRTHSVNTVDGLIQSLPKAVPYLLDARARARAHDRDFILSRKRCAGEDRRVEDIRRVEGDLKVCDEDKILRVLALRSLALDFNTWQMGRGSKTRTEELVNHVLSPMPDANPVQEGRRSAVAEFVDSQAQFSDFKALARRAIHIGVKHLVFERVAKHHLQQLGLSEQCEAISALLAFNIQNFRIMKYEDMPALLRGLLSHDTPRLVFNNLGNSVDGGQHFTSILCDLTPWFEILQAEYQGRLIIHTDFQYVTMLKFWGVHLQCCYQISVNSGQSALVWRFTALEFNK